MSVWARNGAAAGVVALLVVGCAAPLKPNVEPAPADAPNSVDGLVSAIQGDSQRSDHESDGKVRARLADEANSYATTCMSKVPQAAGCLYGRGIALGLEARAHPTGAGELLKSMLASLGSAEAADPNYDKAGPSRVKALVLVRAPGWPLGPGDPDAGLVSARRAVELHPEYPPNQLALAEALAKTGDASGAHDAWSRALSAAQATPDGPEREEWVAEARKGLSK